MGIDGKGPYLAATGGDGDLALGVWQRRGVEELSDTLTPLDLHEQGSLAVVCKGQRQCSGDGGLAGAPLAGHHVQGDARPHRFSHGPSVIRICGWRASVHP
ncbi:unannotated protein [freshwater metagenome]|uniref:Unannotated protein n=1 Tax=freshwater metagenome TaxID=449393 RepID=A0A6J6UI31_9ZZZZ